MVPSSLTRSLPLPNLATAAGIAVAIAAVAASWVSPLLMPVIPALILTGIAVLRWPWLGLTLLVASVPVQQLGAVGGVTATRLSLVVAITGFLASVLVARDPVRGTRLTIPLVALLVWMTATVVVARDQVAAAAEVFRWTTALLAFVLAVHFLSNGSRRRLTGFVAVIAVAGALEALVGTILGLIGFGPQSFAVAGSVTRAYGSFGRPNSFAGYLEMSVFPALWLGVFAVGKTWTLFRTYQRARPRGFASSAVERRILATSAVVTTILVGSAGMMTLGIVLSFSRGAWLGLAAGLAVSGLLALRRRLVLMVALIPILALLAMFALATVAPSTFTDRLTSIADEVRPFDAGAIPITPENFAVVERMAHWQAGWSMFEDHVVTGVGAGNYNERYEDHFVRSEFRFSQGHAHNFYIHTLAETGIVGLVLYLTTALSFLGLGAMVAIRSTDAMARFVALGAVGTMTAVYTHNVFEHLHVLNLGIIISGAWAMAVVAHRLWRAEPNVAAPIDAPNVEYSQR